MLHLYQVTIISAGWSLLANFNFRMLTPTLSMIATVSNAKASLSKPSYMLSFQNKLKMFTIKYIYSFEDKHQ